MKAKINNDECIRCALCEDDCPEIFEKDIDKDIIVILQDELSPEMAEKAKYLSGQCPVGAISVE